MHLSQGNLGLGIDLVRGSQSGRPCNNNQKQMLRSKDQVVGLRHWPEDISHGASRHFAGNARTGKVPDRLKKKKGLSNAGQGLAEKRPTKEKQHAPRVLFAGSPAC
jgi:hypothetical protein